MSRLIRGGCILSMDPKLGDLPRGDILIEDGRILEIGPRVEGAGAEVVDASGTIVIPGFVDTHRHVWQTALRGIASDWSVAEYGRSIRERAAQIFRPEDMYAAQHAGALEALDAGVTTVVDYCHNVLTPDHAFEAVRGLRDAGIRAVWCFGFNFPASHGSHWNGTRSKAQFARQIAANHFASKDSLLTLGIAPTEPELAPLDQIELEFRTARELAAQITLHMNVYRAEPGRDLEQVAKLLAPRRLLGPDLLLVHMIHTTEAEWRMLADSGTSVSFTPETELQMGMGFPPIGAVLHHGMLPSFGADIVSSNSGDMFFPLRLALQLQRAIDNQPQADGGRIPDGVSVTCHQALEWGTLGGARAAGLADRIGSLTPGKQADLVLIRSDGINLAGWDEKNPAASVLLQAHVGNVDTVLVAGQIVKQHGRLLTDASASVRRLRDSTRYIVRRMDEQTRSVSA